MILSDSCLKKSSAPSLLSTSAMYLSHLECKYASRDTKYKVNYECVVLVKNVWHKQKPET